MKVLKYAEVQPKDVGKGVSRKVLIHTDQMMLVEVGFPTGGVSPMFSLGCLSSRVKVRK